MKRLFVGIVVLICSGTVFAQDASLIDILQAKGILSKKEVQALKKRSAGKATDNQQALINVLHAKGILQDSDLAQLQGPSAPAAAPGLTQPQVTQWLSHLETRQAELQAQNQAQVEELKKRTVTDGKKEVNWLNRISFFDDIRLRHEGFFQDPIQARNRQCAQCRSEVRDG